MGTNEDELAAKLVALQQADRKALIGQFREFYGKDPPLRLSNHILALAVAYRLQEQVYGGLKPEVRRALLEAKPVPKRASAGTVLIREWHGHHHTVTVHPDRVEYDGKNYRSLTQVASRITGQKRSGPEFFGLRSPRVGSA